MLLNMTDTYAPGFVAFTIALLVGAVALGTLLIVGLVNLLRPGHRKKGLIALGIFLALALLVVLLITA